MNDRTWRKGPPPHIGWWNASVSQMTHAWRWWDGAMWSMPAYESQAAAGAARVAMRMTPAQELVEWTDYWPMNARVPRVDPSKVSA